ncbi:MAG: sigma-70 family RNA polymerase sigma factor, partial [Coriobacteriales bacterium]|nr:sigma-70 family RNA polymerase sigma factor [Coriobacteriales bacterium]
ISLCTEIARGVLYRSLRALDNPLDAEDAAQEILLRVCNKISDLNDPKAFNGWLNSIIINETRRIGSKSAMQVDVLDISDYLDEFEEEQEDFLPMEFTIKEEDRKAMIQVIDKLPVRQREAVVLHYYEGFSVTEVAGMMGVTHQGVSRYLKLAREKVKSELSQPVALPKATVSRLASLPAGVLLALTLSEDSNQLLVEQAPLYRDLLARIGEVVSVIGVTAVATKISWAMLRRVAMAVFATVTIAFGAWVLISVVAPQPPDALVLPEPALEFGGRVQFSGGNPEDTRINPNRAVAAASTTDGDMVALNWWITTSDSEAILYNGDGGVVSSALTQLQSDGKSGEYLVHYRMQDVQGDIYTLSASFLIE